MELLTGSQEQHLYWLLLVANHELAHRFWGIAGDTRKQGSFDFLERGDWHFLPSAPPIRPPGRLLVPATPLFEEERRSRVGAHIEDLIYP